MKLTLSSAQWAVFMLASIVVAPLSIGAAFGMSQPEIAELLQRTFFIMALTSLLQGIFGHKLPLLEGPAGLWWGVFLMFAGFVSEQGENANTILRSLELGMIVSGVLFLILSALHLINQVKKLFTPVVTATYLILLVSQLSGPFVKGIFGIDYLTRGVDLKVALCSVVTLVCAVILSRSRNRFLSSYSVLISLAFGWILFVIVGISRPVSAKINAWFALPKLWAWGIPTFDIGVVLTSIFTMFLLIANLVAAVSVVSNVISQNNANFNRSGLVMGINQILAGVFAVVGGVTISGSAGFIETTKIKRRLPFLIGSAAILVISFFPAVMTFLASIPAPVGYATIFLSMASMVGLALKQCQEVLNDEKSRFIIGFSLMAGFGTMFVPEEAWSGLSSALTSILDNGLVVGVIVCIILEQMMKTTTYSKNG